MAMFLKAYAVIVWNLRAIKKIAAFCFVALMLACTNHDVAVPKDCLNEQEMLAVLIDIHLIEGARSGTMVLGDTNNLPDYYARIYQKHNITATQFQKSFRWYSYHPEKLMPIYEKLVIELSKKEEEVKAGLKEDAGFPL